MDVKESTRQDAEIVAPMVKNAICRFDATNSNYWAGCITCHAGTGATYEVRIERKRESDDE